MNTYTHLIFNTAVLNHKRHKSIKGIGEGRRLYWTALICAFIPDAVTIGWVIIALIQQIPLNVLFDDLYFNPSFGVDLAVKITNSLVIAAVIFFLGLFFKNSMAKVAGASLFLHDFTDFFLHHDDGHPHLFPITDFIFESPVSYWDEAHYAYYVYPLETILLVVSSVFFYRLATTKIGKISTCIFLFVILGLQTVAFII